MKKAKNADIVCKKIGLKDALKPFNRRTFDNVVQF